MSTREQILQAVFATISAIGGATFQRNGVLPTRIPASGLVILRDGAPGDPEVTLSPLTYIYEHEATLEVMVQDATTQDAAMDALLVPIGAALEADRTLGGLCDWVAAKAPEMIDLPVEGGEPVKGATVGITLVYGTQHPL